MTWDDTANQQRIYIGDLDSSFALSNAAFSSQVLTGTRYIGKYVPPPATLPTGDTSSLDCDIAHYALWSRVLTAGERTSLETTRPDTAAASDLDDYISFDSGSVINSAGGDNATLFGTPDAVDGPSQLAISSGGFRSRVSRNSRAR
jgi:hypothetical protein